MLANPAKCDSKNQYDKADWYIDVSADRNEVFGEFPFPAFIDLFFDVAFLDAVVIQINAQRFHPIIYLVIYNSTSTVLTQLADFADGSFRIGNARCTALLLLQLMTS